MLSFDFELCYQCGQDEHRKSFCNICNEKTGQGRHMQNNQGNSPAEPSKLKLGDILEKSDENTEESENLLKCNKCGYYSHLTCS
jgi:hypothetical protein